MPVEAKVAKPPVAPPPQAQSPPPAKRPAPEESLIDLTEGDSAKHVRVSVADGGPPRLIGAQLFGAGTSRIQAAGWKEKIGSAPPLPPDGQYWEDPKTKTKRHTHENDRFFGEDYMRDLAKRRAIIEADLVYEFVELVAGYSGQSTTADQYWKASAAGGRAVETIFTNLYTDSQPGGSSTGLSGGDAEKLREEVMKQVFTPGKNDFIDDIQQVKLSGASEQAAKQMAMLLEFSSRLELIRKLSEESKGKISIPSALFELTKDVKAQFAARGDPSVPYGLKADEYKRLTEELHKYGIPLPSVDADPREYTEAVRQYEDKRRSIDAATLVADRTANSDMLQTRRERQVKELNDIVLRIQVWKEPSSSSATGGGAGGGTIEKKANLFSGDGYVDVSDAKMLLLRLMLRSGPSGINEAVLKAWDAVYYDGKFFGRFQKQSKQAEKDRLQQLRINLEAARSIEKMLRKDSGGQTWRESPLNTGLLFVTPQFKASVLFAHHLIRNVCDKQEVPLIDLMTHENVYVYFAQFVAFVIEKQAHRFPGRYMHVSRNSELNSEMGGMLKAFETLAYNADGFLVFEKSYRYGAETSRRDTEAARQAYFDATAHYHSDRYPPQQQLSIGASGGSGKKPTYSPDGLTPFERAALQRAKAERKSHMY